MRTTFRRGRSAFTLIELVVVLIVLAIVSGLVVTLAGWVRRSANYAAISHNQGAIAANLELYRTTFGNDKYPDRLDSLLTTGTTAAVPDYFNEELKGNSTATPAVVGLLTAGTLNADEVACLSHGGTFRVMDHDATAFAGEQGNPGNSANTERALAAGGNVALIDTTSPNGIKLIKEIYGGAMPTTGVKLVAFGVGPSNTALGKTLQNPPIDTRIDNSKEYGRFIAVFAVYSPRAGQRAQLKAVLSARGRTQNSGLSEFWQSTTPD